MVRLLTFLMLACGANAATLTFQWNASPTNEQVLLYKLYERSGVTFTLLGATNATNLVVPGVVPGQHFFSITASNVWGESVKSVEVSTPPLPTPPTNITIQVSGEFQGSTNLNGPWITLTTFDAPPLSSQYTFYRSKVFIHK